MNPNASKLSAATLRLLERAWAAEERRIKTLQDELARARRQKAAIGRELRKYTK